MADGREALKEWQKARDERMSRVDEDSKKACQKFATLVIQNSLQKKYDSTQSSFQSLLDADKFSGSCQWKHFKPIMKEQCQTTFGQTCAPISGVSDLDDQSYWGFKMSI